MTPYENHAFAYFQYPAVSRPVSFIKRPTSTIFMCDIGYPRNPSEDPSKWVENRAGGSASSGYARFPNDSNFYGADPWNIYPRHAGARANVLYFDGHVGSVDIAKDIIAHPPGDPACIYQNN